MPNSYIKVNIPYNNPDKMIKLCRMIIVKEMQMEKGPEVFQEIDMAKFNQITDDAEHKLYEARKAAGNAESINQRAYSILGVYKGQTINTKDTILNRMGHIRHILQSCYFDNLESISAFGFDVVMGKYNSNVKMPQKSINKIIAAAQKTVQRHELKGEDSPLKGYDMNKFKNDLNEAVELSLNAQRVHDISQTYFEQSYRLMGFRKGQTINTHGTLYCMVGQIRDYLLYYCKGNEQGLEEYGFDVVKRVASRRKKKISKTE